MERHSPFIIDEVIPASEKVKRFRLKSADGNAARGFLPGQCLFIRTTAKGVVTGRAYSISSAPKDAELGYYEIAVEGGSGTGFVSDAIFGGWKKGDTVLVSRPEGKFFYRPGIDKENVVCLSGGVGITPFMSMARDYGTAPERDPKTLTLVVCGGYESDFIYKTELDAIAKANPGVRVFYVAEHPVSEGVYEGYVTEALLKQLPIDLGGSTFFVCGPRGMMRAMETLFSKLGLRSELRSDYGGEEQDVYALPGYPKEAKDKSFSVKVTKKDGSSYSVPALTKESLLTSLERGGVAPISGCRSGMCGYCMAKWRAGDLFIPEYRDHRTDHQKTAGFINLCSSFPLGDVEIELPY